ncbi:hypothetical protein [Delftia lacustris]|uniref:DUF7948 domain-containing protein n=1 Tax=Delftia lacustris TaxID=558537 RepID=UPI0035A709E7
MNLRSLCIFKGWLRPLSLSLLSYLCVCVPAGLLPVAFAKTGSLQDPRALQGIAIPFEANSGQFDERVAFMGRSFAGAIYVTREGVLVYSLPSQKTDSTNDIPPWSLTETLVGANALQPQGGEQAPTKVSRFSGLKSYQSATYHKVQLGEAWPGIEVELAARGSNVEKLFYVAPHADASRIQVRLDGAQSIRVGEGGELIATTGNGEVAYTAPVAFQRVDGKRMDVSVQYVLNEQGDGYGFTLGPYDHASLLVIDPLLQSTYLGGRSSELVRALVIDEATGDLLASGFSGTIDDFPGTAGGAQPMIGGGTDSFVVRLSGDLKTLRQSTYLGGGGSEDAVTLAIDNVSGDVLVGGFTSSLDFPGTAGGAQSVWSGGGGTSGYVTRLSGDLKTLHQSTYLSGNAGLNYLRAIAIDAATGDVLVGGQVAASGLPGTTGGAQPVKSAGIDGFVARLAGDLKSLRQSTYIGGSGDDRVSSLSLDTVTGDLLVGGRTSAVDFPGVANGAQALKGAGEDGFVARLTGDLKSLRQSTYLGGNDDEYVHALAIDSATGEVVVGGETRSSNLPGTAGGIQEMLNGSGDGFVARFSGNLEQLRQTTYLGGGSVDSIGALAIDTNTGDVLVAGRTYLDFPGTAAGAQAIRGADDEGFIARLSGGLKSLRQSTYLGSDHIDFVGALAIDAATGHVLVGGRTSVAGNFPGTSGGAQSVRGGGDDGFVSRLTGDLKAVSPQTIVFPAQANQVFSAGARFAIDPLAVANSGLPVSYASAAPSICTVAGDMVTMVSAGTCTVVASQAGNAQWEPADDVSVNITIVPLPTPQSITFPAQASHNFVSGGSFAIDPSATASSGLPVSYFSSTTGVCTVSASTVTMVSAGTCTVVASQAGNAQWEPADDVSVNITIVPLPTPQSITFPAQASHNFVSGGSFAIDPSATASSGLPVSYFSSTTGVCTVSASTVTMVSAGTCTVVASQAGNAQWEPADDVSVNITIVPLPATQSITFPAQANHNFVFGDSFVINPPATAGSGLPVSYASSTPAVCTVLGSTVTMVSAGTCTVVASQGGNAHWQPAADVPVNIALTGDSGTPGSIFPVPASSTWPLVLMSLLVGVLGWLRIRRCV